MCNFRCVQEVREFVSKIDAPVCDTLDGKRCIFREQILSIQVCLECTERRLPNYGVTECDLLIVLGARFSDRVTGNAKNFANNAKILQIDVDAAEINKNINWMPV